MERMWSQAAILNPAELAAGDQVQYSFANPIINPANYSHHYHSDIFGSAGRKKDQLQGRAQLDVLRRNILPGTHEGYVQSMKEPLHSMKYPPSHMTSAMKRSIKP